MSDYTRVTIVGTRQKADLVLPDTEPVSALLPDVLDLLDETAEGGARPVALSTTVGEQLDASLTLAEQEVRHGTILRLVRVDAAPPPPDVADVTDVVSDTTSTRPDAWNRGWGTAAAATIAAVLGVYAAPTLGALESAVPVALGVAAVIAARLGHRPPSVVLAGAAIGSALSPATTLAKGGPGDDPIAVFLVWFALAGIVAAAAWAVGLGQRAVGLGALAGPALVAVWFGAQTFGVDPTPAAAITTILGALLLGLLPGVAMSLSGLSGIDDRVVEGHRVAREETRMTVHAAHRTLTAATVTTALVIGALACQLMTTDDLWGRLVAAAVSLLLLLRVRIFPLAPQRLTLIAGGAAPLVAFLVGWAEGTSAAGTLALLAVVVVLALLVGWRPPAHIAARLRRAAGTLELFVVLPLVPLLLASLGVFDDLLGTF